MNLQEAIEFLEDLQPDVCENCTMSETCDNAGTGICISALNILKAEALRAADLQSKIDSGELVEVVHSHKIPIMRETAVFDWKCENCDMPMCDDDLYCPSCGAKMDNN